MAYGYSPKFHADAQAARDKAITETLAVWAPTPEEMAGYLRKEFHEDEIAELIQLLQERS